LKLNLNLKYVIYFYMICKHLTTNSLKDNILLDCLTLEDGTDKQSCNFGEQMPTYPA